MADDAAPAQVRRLRAAAHPLRLRMLSLLTGAEMSAAEVARALDTTHANASYHLRVLLEAGEVEVAGEERIRGGVAKRYRHPWRRLSDEEREAAEADGRAGRSRDARDHTPYVRAMGEELVRRWSVRAAGPVRSRGVLSDAEVWVAQEAWDRALALLTEAGELLHDAAQPPGTPGTRHVALTVGAFPMDEGTQP